MRRFRSFLWMLVMVFLILFPVQSEQALAASTAKEKAESVATAFIKAMARGDIAKAKSLCKPDCWAAIKDNLDRYNKTSRKDRWKRCLAARPDVSEMCITTYLFYAFSPRYEGESFGYHINVNHGKITNVSEARTPPHEYEQGKAVEGRRSRSAELAEGLRKAGSALSDQIDGKPTIRMTLSSTLQIVNHKPVTGLAQDSFCLERERAIYVVVRLTDMPKGTFIRIVLKADDISLDSWGTETKGAPVEWVVMELPKQLDRRIKLNPGNYTILVDTPKMVDESGNRIQADAPFKVIRLEAGEVGL